MSEVTIRFNAPVHHLFLDGELEIAGGGTATVTRAKAKAYAETNPEIEIVDESQHGRGRVATEPAATPGEKEAK